MTFKNNVSYVYVVYRLLHHTEHVYDAPVLSARFFVDIDDP